MEIHPTWCKFRKKIGIGLEFDIRASLMRLITCNTYICGCWMDQIEARRSANDQRTGHRLFPISSDFGSQSWNGSPKTGAAAVAQWEGNSNCHTAAWNGQLE